MLGFLAGWFNHRKGVMMGAALATTAVLGWVIYWPTVTVLGASIAYFLFGLFGTFVLAFVVIRTFIDTRYVGTAVGFVNMLSIIGSATLTFGIGKILDWVRSSDIVNGEPVDLLADFHFGLMAAPLFYFIAATVVVPFIRDGKNQRTFTCFSIFLFFASD